jgi:hypothetical protein
MSPLHSRHEFFPESEMHFWSWKLRDIQYI